MTLPLACLSAFSLATPRVHSASATLPCFVCPKWAKLNSTSASELAVSSACSAGWYPRYLYTCYFSSFRFQLRCHLLGESTKKANSTFLLPSNLPLMAFPSPHSTCHYLRPPSSMFVFTFTVFLQYRRSALRALTILEEDSFTSSWISQEEIKKKKNKKGRFWELDGGSSSSSLVFSIPLSPHIKKAEQLDSKTLNTCATFTTKLGKNGSQNASRLRTFTSVNHQQTCLVSASAC